MGQKVHPYGFRLGVTKTWRSRWFAKHDYAELLREDLELKKMLRKRLKSAGVSSIEIDRPGNKLRLTIRTSRPGIVIGRKGAEIEKLKAELTRRTNRDVYIDIQEVHKPELDAQLVTESIALQLEKRVAFRRAMRKAVDSALRFGCKGIKVRVSGRLNGAEIARSEWYLQGRLPLHTLRADIDYGFSQAYTTYGVIGVKCWIYKGEILDDSWHPALKLEPEPRRLPRRERRPRHEPQAPPVTAAPPEGAPRPVQPPPAAIPKRSAAGPGEGPLMPPLVPPKPAWKEELGKPAAEPAKPEDESAKAEAAAPAPETAAPPAAPETAAPETPPPVAPAPAEDAGAPETPGEDAGENKQE